MTINAEFIASFLYSVIRITTPLLFGAMGALICKQGGVLHIAHAGDSRCYLKTALGVKQVTTDHSFVQQLVESGAITEDEARVHPQRNLITRVVGVHPEVECDYGCYKFEPGDLALSCTDGLSNYLERDTLLLFISNYQGEELADELIRYANSKGGSDNVTVAVIENR